MYVSLLCTSPFYADEADVAAVTSTTEKQVALVWLLLGQHTSDGMIRAMACHALSGMLTQAAKCDRVGAALLADDSLPNLLQLAEKADAYCQVSLAAGMARAVENPAFVSLAQTAQSGVLLRHYACTPSLSPTAPDDLQAEYATAAKVINASVKPTQASPMAADGPSYVTLDLD